MNSGIANFSSRVTQIPRVARLAVKFAYRQNIEAHEIRNPFFEILWSAISSPRHLVANSRFLFKQFVDLDSQLSYIPEVLEIENLTALVQKVAYDDTHSLYTIATYNLRLPDKGKWQEQSLASIVEDSISTGKPVLRNNCYVSHSYIAWPNANSEAPRAIDILVYPIYAKLSFGKSKCLGILSIISPEPKVLSEEHVLKLQQIPEVDVIGVQLKDLDQHYSKSEHEDEVSSAEAYNPPMEERENADIGNERITEEELNKFIDQYKDDLKNVEEELEREFVTAHPAHPATNAEGKFIGYVHKYPLYRTEAGDEFVLQRGTPKPVKRL